MKVLLSGGGTLGPVTPLLAVMEYWRAKDTSMTCVWVGTEQGPERAFVEREGIPFHTLPTARLVRYPSKEWLLLPWRLGSVFWRAWRILKKEQPTLIACAGGYTSVPLVIVGRWMGIPAWIHQSDVRPILTNRLLAPFAKWITVSWPQTARAFPSKKTVCFGNPVRTKIFSGDRLRAAQRFGLDPKKQTVFIFGGGTGSQWLNQMVDVLRELLPAHINILHVTGGGKRGERTSEDGYCVMESLGDEMADAYALADVVVSRAGAGAISELSALRKSVIAIPLPQSPQEANARAIKQAATIFTQGDTSAGDVAKEILRLLDDSLERVAMGERLFISHETDGAQKIVGLLTM